MYPTIVKLITVLIFKLPINNVTLACCDNVDYDGKLCGTNPCDVSGYMSMDLCFSVFSASSLSLRWRLSAIKVLLELIVNHFVYNINRSGKYRS